MDFSKYTYNVEGQTDFSLTDALRLWKAKFPEFVDFQKDVITSGNAMLREFGDFVESVWDTIQPTTVQEALAQSNNETRRVYFSCIGTEKLFKSLEPKLRDKQVIKKKRHGWDENNKEEIREFEDVYELYEIDGRKMFEKNRWGGEANPVWAVRCWCTTTNREYWLYVPDRAALGQRFNSPATMTEEPFIKYDVIRAIAWTIRIDVTDPERIYRQGDIIVAKLKPESKVVEPYHITKDQYLNLMYSET